MMKVLFIRDSDVQDMFCDAPLGFVPQFTVTQSLARDTA